MKTKTNISHFLPLFLSTFMLGCAAFGGGAELTAAPFEKLEDRATAHVEKPVVHDARTVVIRNARVWTATGELYDPGYVVFDEKILDLGPGEPPPSAQPVHVINAAGKHVTPGLIDTHSHLGVYPRPGAKAHGDGNEMSHPVTPGVWAEHSAWPQDPGFELALAGGITSLQLLPGSANLVGGRGVVLHLEPHRGSRAMRLEGAPETVKMACGENPKRVYGEYRKRAPGTRMGNVRGQRQAFANAKAYLAKRQANPNKLDRDIDMETLAGVLEGRILPQIHCYRADDMLSFLQMADEFGFKIRSFHHALEAYKIRDILAEREVAVSTWADWWGFKMEAYDGIQENLAMVHDAGGLAVVHSDSAVGIQRLNQEAAKALRQGRAAGLKVTKQDALKWITWNPAWALGIEDQVGSLEKGKRADLVIWDKDPFSVYASAQYVFVDGMLRYDMNRGVQPWSDFELGRKVAP